MSEEERSKPKSEYTESMRNIKAWKAHLLRSSNQDEAKLDALQKLNESSCLIVMETMSLFNIGSR